LGGRLRGHAAANLRLSTSASILDVDVHHGTARRVFSTNGPMCSRFRSMRIRSSSIPSCGAMRMSAARGGPTTTATCRRWKLSFAKGHSGVRARGAGRRPRPRRVRA
jgi:hypothetical protein